MINYQSYFPGTPLTPAANALDQVISAEFPEQSYSQMIRFRLSGKAGAECRDAYFIATENERCVSRLWYGWGKHADAVGNFGNFRTDERYQHRGIGKKLLQMWQEDLQNAAAPPLALFCSAGKNLVPVYAKFGFRLALENTDHGPLYLPLGDSPATFREFCRFYYSQTSKLHFLPGTVGYRHEIDLLLRFALLQEYGELPELPYPSFEAAILALDRTPQCGKLELIATAENRTVGWAFTPAGGKRRALIHPAYRTLLAEQVDFDG